MKQSNSNSGVVNTEAVKNSTIANGGNFSQKTRQDGTVHTTCYLRTSDGDTRRISWDSNDGSYSNVHSTKGGRNGKHVNYKGAK